MPDSFVAMAIQNVLGGTHFERLPGRDIWRLSGGEFDGLEISGVEMYTARESRAAFVEVITRKMQEHRRAQDTPEPEPPSLNVVVPPKRHFS
jgi:hypothetical protein